MATILKYKGWIIGLALVLLVLFIYWIFTKGGSTITNPDNSCPSSFTINPLGSIVPDVASVTYSTSGGKYFSQTRGGYGGYGVQLAPREITQDEFNKACDKYKASQSTPNT